MRDMPPGGQRVRTAKDYREQQDKKNRRNSSGVREQSMPSDCAYLTVPIMGLTVGVLMQRDDGQKIQRKSDNDKALKCFSPGRTIFIAAHL